MSGNNISRDAPGVLGRIAARVFQFVGEHMEEAIVICWLAEKVILFLFPAERPPAMVFHLDPPGSNRQQSYLVFEPKFQPC